MLFRTILLSISAICTDCLFKNDSEDTDKHRLVNTLFKNYNKKLRPVVNFSDVINVTLSPALYSIVQVDEIAESVTILQWFAMSWNDDYMKWNSSDFGGMSQIFYPISEIWYPDISFDNRIDLKSLIPEENNYATINYDGAISIIFQQVLTIRCTFHIILFPFDIQNCTMIIGSWSYNSEKLDIFCTSPIEDMSAYNENPVWDLITMTARKSNRVFTSSTPYATVYYDIIIQRKPSYYMLIFVLPSFIIMTVSIIGIFAPFNDSGEREEKVTMGLTTLLTMTVILPLITEMMPKNSEGLPLLGIYIMLQIAIGAFTSLIGVIVMYLNRKWTLGEPIPTGILILTRLNRKRRNSLAHETKFADTSAHSYNADEINVESQSPVKNHHEQQLTIILRNVKSFFGQIHTLLHAQNEEEDLQQEWQRATERLDILLIIVFLVFNCILTTCFLSIGYSNLQAPLLLL